MTESSNPIPVLPENVPEDVPESPAKTVPPLSPVDAIRAAKALFGVIELAWIPESTSVLATCRVDVDGAGELCACERLRRFARGATDS